MATSVADVAEEIQSLLQKNGKDVITFPWPDFYEVAGRERMKDAFKSELDKALRMHGLLISYGQAVVLVGKDFKFSTVKLS